MAGGERPVRGPAVKRQRGAYRFVAAATRTRSGSPPRRGTGMTKNGRDNLRAWSCLPSARPSRTIEGGAARARNSVA